MAISINTALVDELVRLMNSNIPLASVQVERKLGWKVSAAAFAFAFLSVTSYSVAYFVLKWQTERDHVR